MHINYSLPKIDRFNGSYRWLSNFYPIMGGIALADESDKSPKNSTQNNKREQRIYPSVENAYQASKFPAINRDIFTQISPYKAKEIGNGKMIHSAKSELENKSSKISTMLDLVTKKFQEPVLRSLLLGTTQQYLIEGNNWHDNFWGVCQCAVCGDANSEVEGLNNLGKTIMAVRSTIVTQEQLKVNHLQNNEIIEQQTIFIPSRFIDIYNK